jgi:dTDP-L-rhamnose 4-epimerase
VYAATRLHTEHVARCYGREAALAALRYRNVYEPGMPRDTPYACVAAIFRSQLEHVRSPPVLEDGNQVRDFVDVEGVTRANLPDRDTDAAEPFDSASGSPHDVPDANALAASVHGPPPEVNGRGGPDRIGV